jgi:hypothetical protein
MTTHASADGQVGFDGKAYARVLAGLVILAAGLWATARIAYWYGADNVFVGGAHLRDPSAARLPAFVAGVVTLAGVAVLVTRRRARGTRGLLGLACLTVIGIAGAWLAVTSYPSATRAQVTSHGNPAVGRAGWATVVPLTIITGLKSVDGTVVVTGSAMDHGCNGRYLAVTIDRSDGRVLDVADSSSPHYLGTGHIDPQVAAAQGLAVEQGVSQVTCSY